MLYSRHKLTFGFTNSGMSTISEELVKNIIFNKNKIIQYVWLIKNLNICLLQKN